MENKMKPVWRLNLGKGIPNDLGSESMYCDGSVMPTSDIDRMMDGVWHIEGIDCLDIYAYRTTRFKLAKRP